MKIDPLLVKIFTVGGLIEVWKINVMTVGKNIFVLYIIMKK